MLEKLFSSKARVEILKLFLFNASERFYQNQIKTLSRQPIRAVQRETEKLSSMGLIEKSVEGNRTYYRINKGAPIIEELKSIFFKFEGIAEALKVTLKSNGKIKTAFIYGSYAKGKETAMSDIDLFIIGTITSKEVSTLLSKTKDQLGREINYTVMPQTEFRNKIQSNDHFLSSLISEKKIFLIGTPDELKTTVRTR
jgi:uncharacterized protein